jgi:hypothetical protein
MESTPPRWPPPVIFSWTLPELMSMSTGTGASSLPTASRLPSGLNAIAEIFPIPGANGRRAGRGERRSSSATWSGALARGAASKAPSELTARACGLLNSALKPGGIGPVKIG